MSKKKILAVDDEPYVLRVIQMKLQNAGYEVETVTNGIEAWEKIKSGKPDMLITDIAMPGLNGYELTRKVRMNENFRDLPVLMLTGRGENKDELKGYEAGVNQFLTKPFSPRELLSMVEEILTRDSKATVVKEGANGGK